MSIYFVDPARGDDDANDGLGPAKPEAPKGQGPFRSVARANKAVKAGDTLHLHAGSLYGSTSFILAGTPAAPILVEPYEGTQVVFDGAVPDLTVPNTQWERVPGHSDEWRTSRVLDHGREGRILFGAFADSGIRLISYSRIEDLRATNESFVRVPLSDPREAGGPLNGDPSRKTPWTYLGPGLHWVPEDPTEPQSPVGRVHVRLAPTHLNAPGTRDYTGPSDPNRIGLALTPEHRVAVTVAASHARFRGLVIRNGGKTTFKVQHSQDVTFDHCTVSGAQFGVRISGSPDVDGVTFKHCTFDGGLAPWTTRGDVKEDYRYVDTDTGQVILNGGGSGTHDILVISGANNAHYAWCTFRRAHDALQPAGTNVSVHHCLFEDINDEVLQFNGASNVHVYKNVIRQALDVFSFHVNHGLGPIYIYRNVIDQRIPTRGDRTLPPDAPAPQIWRYGASFKSPDKSRMPAVYVYQNTFIGSHLEGKGGALTLLFASGHLFLDAPRIHLNNLLVGLNLDLMYSWAMSTSPARLSQGNLWHEPNRKAAALFVFQHPAEERVDTIDRLHQLDPRWELGSVFAEPKLANFDDEIFDHGLYLGDVYPDNDFRPASGSPAIGAGVVLPAELTDPDRPAEGTPPDIGALAACAPPLRVGVDQATVFPAPEIPVTQAGPGQLLFDTDGVGIQIGPPTPTTTTP